MNEFAGERLYYNAEQDYIICPMGQHMQNIGSYKQKNKSSFEQSLTRYQAKNCEGCPMRGVCHKSKYNRIVELNHNLIRLKKKAAEKLRSEEGIRKRKKRCSDVEPVFANWKQNKGFRRTNLRGKEKVLVEIGLIAMAHNLQKFSKPKIKKWRPKRCFFISFTFFS